MNKRRRKKEIVKRIMRLVEKDRDFVYFKSYGYTGLPESYILPLNDPALSMSLSSDVAPAVEITAYLTNQQAIHFISQINKEGRRF